MNHSFIPDSTSPSLNCERCGMSREFHWKQDAHTREPINETREDSRDAIGSNPGDFKVENGIIYVCNVWPIKVGPDEYETRLRWHIAKHKDVRKYKLGQQKRVALMLTVLEQTENQ